MRRAPQCLELTSCFSGRTAASAERRQQRTQGSQTMCSQSIHNFLTCLFFGLSWQTALELSVSSLCCFVGLLWLTTSLVGFVLCRCSGHWGSLQISVSGRVWASIFYAAKHGAPTSFLHTEDNPLRWKSSILLPSNLGGYCGNKGAMVTVTGGVTEVTTVAMETASQWAIFEASEKRHAPSLITVCVRKKKLSVSSLHVCLASIMRTGVGWPLCLHVAV